LKIGLLLKKNNIPQYVVMAKNQERFINDLCKSFPEIEKDINDEDYLGIFSLQIGVFRQYTQNAINNKNFDLVNKYTKFISEQLQNIHKLGVNQKEASNIENSLILSYIGKLDFKDYSAPQWIIQTQKELQEYNYSVVQDDKLIKFLEKNQED